MFLFGQLCASYVSFSVVRVIRGSLLSHASLWTTEMCTKTAAKVVVVRVMHLLVALQLTNWNNEGASDCTVYA